ncbi:hypothetical protein GCM10009566_60180 [Streptomyces murinus]
MIFLKPDDGGWSSGGFISDSKIDGQIQSGSRQQFLAKNSRMGSWSGSNWNMVFVGDQGAPASPSRRTPTSPPHRSTARSRTSTSTVPVPGGSSCPSRRPTPPRRPGAARPRPSDTIIDPSVVEDHSFEVPQTSGVKFHDMVTVVLGGAGTITHIVNSTGATVTTSNNVAYLTNYP